VRVSGIVAIRRSTEPFVSLHHVRTAVLRSATIALRYFTLDGTDHESHKIQGRMIRRYIAWRNRNAHDRALQELIKRANVA
jgi:hypothetical protein